MTDRYRNLQHRARILRKKYCEDARFVALFGNPDYSDPHTFGQAMCLTGLSSISEGFALDDVPNLLEVACHMGLDIRGEEDEKWYNDPDARRPTATLHALQAILRLCDDIKGQPQLADAVAKGIAHRALLLDDQGNDDYAIEELFDACAAILMYLGRAAVPHILRELRDHIGPDNVDTPIDHPLLFAWAVGDTLLGIVLLESDLSLARQVLDQLLLQCLKLADIYEQAVQQRDDGRADRAARLLSHMGCVVDNGYNWVRFGPALRDEPVLRDLRRLAHPDVPGQLVAWVATVEAAGLSYNPNDTEMVRVMDEELRQRTAMWGARHEAGVTPPPGPFPGQQGYHLPPLTPGSWHATWECAEGTDCTPLLDTAGAPPGPVDGPLLRYVSMSRRGQARFEKLRYSRPLGSLTACSLCRGEMYCCKDCQRRSWSGKHSKQDYDRPVPFVPPPGPLRYGLSAVWPWSVAPLRDHKYKCRLLQALWREAGIDLTGTSAEGDDGVDSVTTAVGGLGIAAVHS